MRVVKAEGSQIIILHESVAQSWARDASSLVMAVAMIGIGVWLESSAMQWIGGIVWLLVLMSKASGVAKKMTIGQARQKLDEIEGVAH